MHLDSLQNYDDDEILFNFLLHYDFSTATE